MKATGDFSVASFDATTLDPAPEAIATALPVGVAVLTKTFEGEVRGRSATIFTSAFDPGSGTGTYVAMESFAGSLHDVEGSFNFVHAASTTGSDRAGDYFLVVPGSGTGGLASIRGTGGLTIEDGRHTIWFDYELD